MAVRKDRYMRTFSNHMESNCIKGVQKDNLTHTQRSGLKRLQKRIKDDEAVVLQTDKTGGFAVCSLEDYTNMGWAHVKGDTEITWEKAAENQRIINRHTSMWIKMAGLGQQLDQVDRIRESMLCKSNLVPPLYLLAKDHKPLGTDGLPSTRPVVSGCKSMTFREPNPGYM